MTEAREVTVTEQEIRGQRTRRNLSVVGAALQWAMFAFVCFVTSVPNPALAVLAVFFTVAALVQTGTLRRMRAAAKAAGRPDERPQTHAEAVAEAVEARRQRQWDVIAERAYLAAGGQAPRPAPKVDPAQWLVGAADEFMRTGQRPLGLLLPEGMIGVMGAQGDVLAGRRKRERAAKLTAWLEDGRILTECRWSAGGGAGLPPGASFTLFREDPEGISPAGGFTRQPAAPDPCAHPGAEPVDLITGERVAWVCPDCPAELPANWRS